MSSQENSSGEFEKLINSMMNRRLFMSLVILITFLGIIGGIGVAISINLDITEQWKELLLLLLGAFIGSYGKIIDYWFRDNDKDKMLVQKMDEEDGVALSDTSHMDLNNGEPEISEIPLDISASQVSPQVGVEIDEDGDGTMDGIDKDGDGDIDEYFAHRNCEHVWGDKDNDGQEECLICGLIKEND
jgi:hypothetical protein